MSDLLIEIGTEEIPSSYARPALEAMGEALRAAAAEQRLRLPAPTLLGTPRRLVLHFAGVSDHADSVTEERRGPAAKAAFAADGTPTKAAEGFARSLGIPVAELRVVDTPKGPYAAATVRLSGAPAADVLAAALPRALRAAGFPKTMRWTGSDLPFARPIRRLVVLLGDAVVPVRVAGVDAGRETRGHHFLSPAAFALPDADLDRYVEALRERNVLVDPQARRDLIRAGLAERIGHERAAAVHEGLLDEVTWLSEWPMVIEGRIDPEYLEIPVEVLETAMRVHLRYFPVLAADGSPEARFLSVMDRTADSARLVAEGNERVLRSRLSDARFFLREDRQRTLLDRLPGLVDKAVHRELGSYRAKVDRLAALCAWLAPAAGRPAAVDAAVRAAMVCKSDLTTLMVGEFPELQGTVGRVYALREGLPPAVAEAIEDHYRPRGPGEALPRGDAACVLALAEKIDNLCGFFMVGGAPSGSSDPFGLRRQALGLLRICSERNLSFPLSAAFDRGLALLSGKPDLKGAILEFVKDRLYHAAVEEGHRYDLVRAVLAAGFDDLPDFRRRLLAVREMSGMPWWPQAVTLVERTANILRGQVPGAAVSEALLAEPAERALDDALGRTEPEVARLVAVGRFAEAGVAFAEGLTDAVQEFFAQVFVNVEDAAVRANRLALLRRVHALMAARVADLSLVEVRPA